MSPLIIFFALATAVPVAFMIWVRAKAPPFVIAVMVGVTGGLLSFSVWMLLIGLYRDGHIASAVLAGMPLCSAALFPCYVSVLGV